MKNAIIGAACAALLCAPFVAPAKFEPAPVSAPATEAPAKPKKPAEPRKETQASDAPQEPSPSKPEKPRKDTTNDAPVGF